MSSVASIPLRYSSLNGSKFLVKTGFLPILYDVFALAKVLVHKFLLRMTTDNISTLTSDVPSVAATHDEEVRCDAGGNPKSTLIRTETTL